MERAHDGGGAEGQFRDGTTDLEETQTAAASRGVVQVQQRSTFCPEGSGHCGALYESARQSKDFRIQRLQIRALQLLQLVVFIKLEIVASKIAGHSTVRMTEEYTKIQLTRQEELTRRIQERLASVGEEQSASVVKEPNLLWVFR